MIFEVDPEILSNESHHHPLFEVTVSTWGLEAGRHQWHLADPEAFEDSPWFKEYLSEPQKANFKKTVTRSAHGNPKGKRNFFKISDKTDSAINVFSLLDAKKMLSFPMTVVLENADSDGSFVSALIRCFGKKSINEALKQNWLKFDNAGGSGGLGSAILRMERQLTDSITKRRVFVLSDSDCGNAKDRVEYKAPKKILELKIKGYEIYVLYKRMIENYLPDGALEEIVKKKENETDIERLKVVKRFSPEQRDYYHFKNGFNGEGIVPPNQSHLFTGALANPKSLEFKAIRKGFGKDLPLTSGFGLTHLVTDKSLRDRCSHHPNEHKDELENIVKTLTEML